MNDSTSNDTDPETAISLAETFLEHHRQELSSGLGATYEKEIERWEGRKEELEEDDDLYDLAEQRIQEAEDKLEELQTETEEVQRDLLQIVAADFTAQGDWLDPSLLRALNLILFDKYSNSFVVKRQLLDDETTLEGDELYSVSKAVRELAKERLGEQ